MKLSIVTTLYYSAPYIEEFCTRVSETVSTITDDYEIILVNDGSPDTALNIALDLHNKDKHICVVDLSRNFGHHKAIMTGLSVATGDYVFLIDCDLEIAPENLIQFYERMQAGDTDVVYGVQEKREDPLVDQILGTFFYQIFNRFSSITIPENITIMRLMTRQYVEQLLQYQERVFIIAGLWAHSGFRQTPLSVQKKHKGTSTYNFARKLDIMVYSIIVFSNKPLVYIAGVGMLIIIASILWLAWLIFGNLVLGFGVPGWTSLMVSLWFVGGLNIFITGVVALYLSVIFEETKQRPRSIIRAIHQHTD